jgi:peptidoglycan/LPS O-acetylase OafA/YrhL
MRIESLTPFRFVAAAIVVVFHFGRPATGWEGFLAAGPQMVSFFFVLSGFVMTVAYYHRELDRKAYYWARLGRIFPVYILAFALSLIVLKVEGFHPTPAAIFLNITLLQSWVSPYPLSVNAPGWSLSVEAFFYLIFPFLLFFIKSRELKASTVLALALLIWFITQILLSSVLSTDLYQASPSLSHDLVYYFPPSHLCSFLLGIAGGLWHATASRKLKSPVVSSGLIILAASLIVLLINNQALISSVLGLEFAFKSSFFSPVFLLLVLAVAVARGPLVNLLSTRPAIFLGEISYGLYILQGPVYLIFRLYLVPDLEVSPLQFFCLYFMFLVAVSSLCFLFFERAANSFIRYQLPRRIDKYLAAKKGYSNG